MEVGNIDGAGSDSRREAALWQDTLERVIPAIVVIRVCSTRAFDGSGASYSYATGFVVDMQRGIILTNRHAVDQQDKKPRYGAMGFSVHNYCLCTARAASYRHCQIGMDITHQRFVLLVVTMATAGAIYSGAIGIHIYR